MEPSFTYDQLFLLVKLLIAHCLVDFFLQSSKGIQEKRNRIFSSPSYYLHILLVTLFSWLLTGSFSFWYYAVTIGVLHGLIDAGKLYALRMQAYQPARKELFLFVTDQLLHLLSIVLVWLWMTAGWKAAAIIISQTFGLATSLKILGYIMVIGPARFLIRFIVELWSPDIEHTNDGLRNAGITIGILERILVLTLVLLNQFAAIGFLVTAKSILRLIDRPMHNESPFSSRKHTEYVLIGTFLSFGLAILTGLFINQLLSLTDLT